jgi:hypothetical protein
MFFLEWRIAPVSSFLVVGLLTTWHGAMAACSGDTPKPHQPPAYDFVTNSYVKQCAAYVCFYTCFESKMGQDVRLHWYIPNHVAWVPPGEDKENPRFANSARSFLAHDTCVEYGNNARTVRAPLIAAERERGAVDEEAAKGCVRPSFIKKVDDKSSGVGPPSAFNLPVRSFFPSDGKRPTETMLVLTGEIGLQPSETSFKTYINYAISKYPGRQEGEPLDLRLKPRLEHETEFLLPYFLQAYKEGTVQLLPKGFISFSAPIESPNVASAAFDIVDRGGTIVGTMTLPVFVRKTAN